MESNQIHQIIDEIKHYLPHQAPLKDFIHHNSLQAFQSLNFHDALHKSSKIFGFQNYLKASEYIDLFNRKEISQKTIQDYFELNQIDQSKKDKLFSTHDFEIHAKIGSFRQMWQKKYHININKYNHQILFRLISNYLDQGIAKWQLNAQNICFLDTIRELEQKSVLSFFKSKRAKRLFNNKHTTVFDLLKILVGDKDYFKQYLFDQQFNHPGWSGMVAFIESHPKALFENKMIKLEDVIFIELLLEIDILDTHFGQIWSPLAYEVSTPSQDYTALSDLKIKGENQILNHWQNILEFEHYKKYLSRIINKGERVNENEKTFQAIFCIDDRMCSIRRYIESIDNQAETFGVAGFFYVDIFFKPAGSRFSTKLCPGPIAPTVLIKEIANRPKQVKQDRAFHSFNQTILGGWLYTNTIGFFKSIKLLNYVFNPKSNDLTTSSFDFLQEKSHLTIVNQSIEDIEDGLQVGFTYEEMADKAENLFKTIGLTKEFAPMIYIIGHGASSTNNTHYAGYDCGACSGRPGVVNARIMAFICNQPQVRILLSNRGIHIPETTFFIGGMHDTTIDEITFTDLDNLPIQFFKLHQNHTSTFKQALSLNMRERAKKFDLIDNDDKNIEKKVKARAFSLFEPRPELNHATNMLCVVGNRQLTYAVDLERKSFLNSYNFESDPDGQILLSILNAISPVCGGINLEYFFSRVDNHRLGAGTKLPHNVVGLLGVSNGISGDLRIGLPSQMIEIHQPLRLMMIIEQNKDVVNATIRKNPKTFEWFKNDWIKLSVIEPYSKDVYLFENNEFLKINHLLES